MFGMTKIVDIDGDGLLEIVATQHNSVPEGQATLPPGFLKIYQPNIIKDDALAIQQLAFSGKRQTDGIHLKWSFTGKADFATFQMERSSDGQTFQTIGQQFLKNDRTNYQFLDRTATSNQSLFYRLSWQDESTQTHYSDVVLIESVTADLTIYPNPVGDYLYLNVGATQPPMVAVLLDMQGQEVRVFTHFEMGKALNMNGIAAGSYQLVVHSEEGRKSFSVIKK